MSISLTNHSFCCKMEVMSWLSGGEYDLTKNEHGDEDYQPEIDWDYILELYGADDDKFYDLCDCLESTIKTYISRNNYTLQDIQQLIEEYSSKGIMGYASLVKQEVSPVDKLAICTLGYIYQIEMFN